jgi:hypothetical protein
LHPAPDFGPHAAAALTGTAVPQARQALEVLSRAHLVQPAAPGRYAMHDLLRSYARELLRAADAGDEQDAALARLFGYYLHAAATAIDTVAPGERHHRLRASQPDVPIPPLADPAVARHWLDHERAALVATAEHTAVQGWPGHAARLAILSSYLENGGHLREADAIFGHALDAARRAGDRGQHDSACS